MRMKGMAMVKAKDLVLLSVASKLPMADDATSEAGKPVADKLQIFAATTSVDHPRVPPTPAYNRMQLSVSGFLIEEIGAGGSKIVQITDLSGLGCASSRSSALCSRAHADLTPPNQPGSPAPSCAPSRRRCYPNRSSSSARLPLP